MTVHFKTDSFHWCRNVFFLNLNYGEKQNVGPDEIRE